MRRITIDTAFARIDELRNTVNVLENDMKDRVRFRLFAWIVGVSIAIFSGIMGVMWAHFGNNDAEIKKAIDSLRITSENNSKEIATVIQKIDGYIISNEKAIQRNEIDIGRILDKLDSIEKNTKENR